MKTFFCYIPLFLVLLFAGQGAFADNGNGHTFGHGFSKGQKVAPAALGHTAVFEVMATDTEEEVHSGSQANANPFAVKALPSLSGFKTITVDSITALRAVRIRFVLFARIPSYPLYLTNRVLRL